jgi:hypothetical protein
MVDPQGNNLIFILSAPRSGSTLLGAVLGNHSQTLCPPEPWLLLSLHAMRTPDVMAISHFDSGLARQALNELLDDQLFRNVTNAFAISVYKALLAQANKQIFIDKTPRYYHILPFLEALFPQARKIWIKRNPLDVIASHKATLGHSVADLLGGVVSPHAYDATLSFSLLSSYFAASDRTKTIVSYEALVQDPMSQIQALCQRIDLPFEANMLHYGANHALMQTYTSATMGDKKLLAHARPHDRSVGRWQEVLTPEEIRKILLTLGRGMFTRLGYEDLFEAAAACADLKADDIDEQGKLDQLFQLYASYVDAGFLKVWELQNTVIARQNMQVRRHGTERAADRAARLEVIRDLQQRLQAAEADRAARLEVIRDLQQHLQAAEADRADRLEVIQGLEQTVARLQSPKIALMTLLAGCLLKVGLYPIAKRYQMLIMRLYHAIRRCVTRIRPDNG